MTWLQNLLNGKETAYHATILDKADKIFRDGCISPDMPPIKMRPISYIKASEPGCIYGWKTVLEAAVHAKHLTEMAFAADHGVRGRDPVIIPFSMRSDKMHYDPDSWGMKVTGKAVELQEPVYPFRTQFDPYRGHLMDRETIERILAGKYSLDADLGAYIQGPCQVSAQGHDVIAKGRITLYGSTRLLIDDNMATFGIMTGHRRLETTYCFPAEEGMEKAALSALCSLLDLLAEEKFGNIRKDNLRRT